MKIYVYQIHFYTWGIPDSWLCGTILITFLEQIWKVIQLV